MKRKDGLEIRTEKDVNWASGPAQCCGNPMEHPDSGSFQSQNVDYAKAITIVEIVI